MKMKRFTDMLATIIVICMVVFGIGVRSFAATIEMISYEFENFQESELDWSSSEDDDHSGWTALGFSVALDGVVYTAFDMDSNGYVELLTDASDQPGGYGWGYISELVDYDTTSTYLLAAYDDLSSWDYGYFGYALFADRAVFYYNTETYYDENWELLNIFEMVLSEDGRVQWNFASADYDGYDADLFSGLYFGSSETLLELDREIIPVEESYLYSSIPEPSMLLLLLLGGQTLLRRKRN